MGTAIEPQTGLAYETEGSGVPVVFLHGLTFDRRSWRPIVERLGGTVRSITVDLPAHGESGGSPPTPDEIAARLHALLDSLGVAGPIVVGHSMSGAFACVYAATYPTLGVVVVDNGPDIRPFAEIARRLEPTLRGPDFADAWQMFESTLGLDLLPAPVRSLVLDRREVNQAVVLGYWEMMLRTDPAELQAEIDALLSEIESPLLGVFGRPITGPDRERFDRLPDVQLEEWVGDGHFVHLVDADRFAGRLKGFIDHCVA